MGTETEANKIAVTSGQVKNTNNKY